MRILVTGGTGQLGSEWVRFLNKKEVEFISLPPSDFDLTDHQDVRRVLNNLKPGYIINCAAYTNVDQAEVEKEEAFAVNYEGVQNLANYSAESGVKLIEFSTDYVFPGKEKDQKKLPNGYPEDYPTDPINTYGASKLAGENAIKDSGCDYIICRTSWLCGKYGNNFVKTMLRLGEERKELNVVNDQYGCPTFTANLVKNCWNLVEEKKSGIYHITSHGKITWFEFAKEIFRQTGMQVQVNGVSSSEFPTKATRPAFSLLSTKKIANIPGATLIEWQEGLKQLLGELDT
ncbi:dTDP-4-dehydrorhamnose reductase [Gracilimonas sp.]|uniref:dTDP-4-dehydrorhamnose reductase n=1 Tax=Gracilimonas sp. TaxID=1974203 RepID=UPI0028714FE3|nr:dTDP-4-dehydrorhamnose reductase [Gracilimonas sp.]